MKFRVLSRSDAEWSGRHDGTPTTSRAARNPAAPLHAPPRPLDIQRAVTAAKLARNLARPFLFACAPSHADGVYCLARSRIDVALAASAAADGEVRLWHLPSRAPRFHITPTPAAFTRGITFSHDSSRLLACTDANMVHALRVQDAPYPADFQSASATASASTSIAAPASTLAHTYRSTAGPLSSISASYASPLFATASSAVEIWDETRSTPLQTLALGVDSLHCVRYNPVEPHLLASAGADRCITLYDTRAAVPVRRLVLAMRTNDISWNPIEAFNFVTANDDHNCYTYDMRNLGNRGALTVHQDHVAAVMSVDYSPTGQEFVSGSYDKTIRIFPHTVGKSREVYHTKRMQRVFAVSFSLDGSYITSGSDDGDVRVWKSERSRPLKPLFRNEKEKVQASEKLIERYQGLPEVRRIAKKRHVPGHIKTMQSTKAIMKQSRKRKEKNVRRHTKPENRPNRVADRKKNVVRELE